MIKRALISVSDKTGIIDFAKTLQEKYQIEILSTGGTLKILQEAGLEVTAVDEYTGFPEMMGGRVKTLHPKIHGGLLALRNNKHHLTQAEENNIKLIDLVCVNLYPFQKTIAKVDCTEDEAIENIDIGGPSMLRSAAKNFQSVTVISDSDDYSRVLNELLRNEGDTTLKFRRQLAIKAYWQTAQYDTAITGYLDPGKRGLFLEEKSKLRYGENPHQKAKLWSFSGEKPAGEITEARVLQGKEMSFLNYYDTDAAWDMVRDFTKPAAVFVKHANPCGLSAQDDLKQAFVDAFDCDPRAAFGVIIAVNRKFEKELAEIIEKRKIFVEIIIAPGFSSEALDILRQKKNLRLLNLDQITRKTGIDLKKVGNGMLIQEANSQVITLNDVKAVTEIPPTETQMRDLLFAFHVVKHVKSNAIVLAKNEVTVGIGAGQMSRVDSTEIAVRKAGERANGAVLASDAFFPFADSIEEAHNYGITAIIQPGGSMRDEEIITRANELKIPMVFTGKRAFKH
jgi:phosphoribosylaminoimidazolecarboxamide formyltransferase/IMP cyclohydrolase